MKKKMHGGPHMDKMMGGSKYKMGHGGMYGKKKMPHGGKHDMDMEMYGGGMMTDARNRGSNMQIGGMSLKEVDAMQNPGLAKLPEDVRNKMGYKQKGGNIQDEIMQYGDKIKAQQGMSAFQKGYLKRYGQKAYDKKYGKSTVKQTKKTKKTDVRDVVKAVSNVNKKNFAKGIARSAAKQTKDLLENESKMRKRKFKKSKVFSKLAGLGKSMTKSTEDKLKKVKTKTIKTSKPKPPTRLQRLKAKAKSVASKFKPISVADAKAKKKKDAFKKESKFTTDTYSPIVSRSKTTKTVNRKKKVVTTKSGDQFPVMKKKSQSAKSFRQAFKAARDRGEKTFPWQGRIYTTKLKGE
tara:strand:- start:8262 stop:9311 length:1050 start_codon:yes stop_codon:yes gene_type:complete